MKLLATDEITVVQAVRLPKEDLCFYKVILLDENGHLFECFTDEKTFNSLSDELKSGFSTLDSDYFFNIYFYKGELRLKLFS